MDESLAFAHSLRLNMLKVSVGIRLYPTRATLPALTPLSTTVTKLYQNSPKYQLRIRTYDNECEGLQSVLAVLKWRNSRCFRCFSAVATEFPSQGRGHSSSPLPPTFRKSCRILESEGTYVGSAATSFEKRYMYRFETLEPHYATDKNPHPKYRLHKARASAVVTIDGKNHYLGAFGSSESHEKYARLIAAHRATGRGPLPIASSHEEGLPVNGPSCGTWNSHPRTTSSMVRRRVS